MRLVQKNRPLLRRADNVPASATLTCRPSVAPTVDFYSRLERIWHQVVTLEDMGIIHNELEKFAYAYRLIEAELQCVAAENVRLHQTLSEQKNRALPALLSFSTTSSRHENVSK